MFSYGKYHEEQTTATASATKKISGKKITIFSYKTCGRFPFHWYIDRIVGERRPISVVNHWCKTACNYNVQKLSSCILFLDHTKKFQPKFHRIMNKISNCWCMLNVHSFLAKSGSFISFTHSMPLLFFTFSLHFAWHGLMMMMVMLIVLLSSTYKCFQVIFILSSAQSNECYWTISVCMWTCCDVGLIKFINILLLLIGRNCCILSNSRCFPIRTISLNSVIACFSLSFCCAYIKCNVCRIKSRKCVHMHHCMGAMRCNVRFGATTVVKRKKISKMLGSSVRFD